MINPGSYPSSFSARGGGVRFLLPLGHLNDKSGIHGQAPTPSSANSNKGKHYINSAKMGSVLQKVFLPSLFSLPVLQRPVVKHFHRRFQMKPAVKIIITAGPWPGQVVKMEIVITTSPWLGPPDENATSAQLI